jgi:hypothetical protein
LGPDNYGRGSKEYRKSLKTKDLLWNSYSKKTKGSIYEKKKLKNKNKAVNYTHPSAYQPMA